MRLNIRFSIVLIAIFASITSFNLITGSESIQLVQAITKIEPFESNNITISLSKNATGISQYSDLKFNAVLNNTLSESVHNIDIIVNQPCSYIDLIPSGDLEINIPELTPGETTSLDFTAKIQGEVTQTPVDLLLIIDASGSMGEEISEVKQEITNLTNSLSEEIKELRVGIIIYGWTEYSENPLSHTGNQLPFTSDFDAVRDFINKLYANGGLEPWGDALYLANSWDWRLNSQKLIIIVGDEDCDPGNVVGHGTPGDYYNGSQLVDEVTSLRDKGVIINTVITDNPDNNVEDQFGWISDYTLGKSVFLPNLHKEGVSLPDIIQEWTLELGREFYYEFILDITWEENSGKTYHNSGIETFWLDLTYPSIIVSENIKTTGLNQYSVEFLATVSDISAISFVNLYHNAFGSWSFTSMNPLPNSSNYIAEIGNIQGGYNLTYYIEASDILKNIGTTKDYWLIVETPEIEIGELKTIWAESNESFFSKKLFEDEKIHYLILSGPQNINSILVQIIYPGDTSQKIASLYFTQNVTFTLWRKIFPISYTSGTHFLNLTIPQEEGNFSFSYVWVTLTEMGNTTKETFSGTMTEKIRTTGLQWYVYNGTYFNINLDYQSPLVLLSEIYSTDWIFLGQFSATKSFLVSENASYLIIIWATLRTGNYVISVDAESLTIDDPYYNPSNAADYYSGVIGFDTFLTLLSILVLLVGKDIKRQKNL